jgi:hypothetical protein
LVRSRDYSARLFHLASGQGVLLVRPPARDERPEGAGVEDRDPGPLHLARPFSGDGRFLLLGFPFDELTKREGALMLLGQNDSDRSQ